MERSLSLLRCSYLLDSTDIQCSRLPTAIRIYAHTILAQTLQRSCFTCNGLGLIEVALKTNILYLTSNIFRLNFIFHRIYAASVVLVALDFWALFARSGRFAHCSLVNLLMNTHMLNKRQTISSTRLGRSYERATDWEIKKACSKSTNNAIPSGWGGLNCVNNKPKRHKET